MSRCRVLNLIPRLSFGGPTHCLLAMVRHSRRLGPFDHEVIGLRSSSDGVRQTLTDAALSFVEGPPEAEVMTAAAAADIVLLHFWNTPEVDALLGAEWPPARLALWSHVAGDSPPQLVTSELIAFADLTLATTPYSLELPAFADAGAGRTGLVWSGIDQSRLSMLAPRPHASFNIGYVGLVDDVKLHRRFVAMSAAARIPNARFVVCGDGSALRRLEREARDAGLRDCFEFRGWVRDVAPILQELDVLGHAVCPESYGSAECAVQEAMCAGVVPVTFAQRALRHLVRHEQTGLLVQTEAEYSEALTYLAEHPAERRCLATNARAWAAVHFDAADTGRALNEVFASLLTRPRRSRRWARPEGNRRGVGADRLLHWLGPAAPPFVTSMASPSPADVVVAEEAIAGSSAPIASVGGGGILHYRTAYPDDPHLRLWAGLVLERRGHDALAAAEFHRARQLGLPASRVDHYLRRAAARAGAPDLVDESRR
jgi:glycosyltransferase involved in cell wall biosynthesis